MTVRMLSTNGNNGAVISDLHPDGTLYIARRRDMGAGGRMMAIQQLGADGSVIRTIKVYAERVDGDLRREFPDVPIEDVDGPLGTGSVQCAPDGSLRVIILPGNGGICAFAYELIPNACAPFTHTGTWPLTVSATDDEARRQNAAVVSQLEQLKGVVRSAQNAANQANDDIKSLKKNGPTAPAGGVSRDDVQKMVDDAGFKKALDAIYDQAVNQKDSPLNNVIQQHIISATGPLMQHITLQDQYIAAQEQRIAALEATVTNLAAVKQPV